MKCVDRKYDDLPALNKGPRCGTIFCRINTGSASGNRSNIPHYSGATKTITPSTTIDRCTVGGRDFRSERKTQGERMAYPFAVVLSPMRTNEVDVARDSAKTSRATRIVQTLMRKRCIRELFFREGPFHILKNQKYSALAARCHFPAKVGGEWTRRGRDL